MTREEFFRQFAKICEDEGPRRSHERAEELLLAYLDDPDITAAWEEEMDTWWYA